MTGLGIFDPARRKLIAARAFTCHVRLDYSPGPLENAMRLVELEVEKYIQS